MENYEKINIVKTLAKQINIYLFKNFKILLEFILIFLSKIII